MIVLNYKYEQNYKQNYTKSSKFAFSISAIKIKKLVLDKFSKGELCIKNS